MKAPAVLGGQVGKAHALPSAGLPAQVAFKILVLDPMLDRDREEWSTLGNPCINLAADAQKKAEWERKDAAPKKSRRVHEGARLAPGRS